MKTAKTNKERQIIPPIYDFIFKQIFGTQKNADILADFLCAVLKLPVEDFAELTIIDPNVKRDYLDDKAGVLDVKLKLKSGKIIDIEIQVESDIPLPERIAFYKSKMITEQIGRGQDYSQIKQVICIIITDFIWLADEVCHHSFRMYDKQHDLELTDLEQVDTLELPKVPERDNKSLSVWLQFLNTRKAEDLTMIANAGPMVSKAIAVLMELSADETNRMIAEKQELLRMDRAAAAKRREARARAEEARARAEGEARGIAVGEARGIAKGEARGEARGRVETARNLKQMGLKPADISKATGLSVLDIEKL